MNTQAQALLDRTEQMNPDNLPSRGGSYNGNEIFTMKVGTTWVQGNVNDLLQYLNQSVAVDLAQLQASVTQAANSATQAATQATGAAASATTATTQATAAGNSATSAATSSTTAQAWASQQTGNVAGTSLYSSYYYSQQSQYYSGIAQSATANPSTFDPAYKAASITLANSNLQATFATGQAVVLATNGYTTGKHYFEVTFTSGTASGNAAVGIAPDNEPLNVQIGYEDTTGAVAVYQNSGTVYAKGATVGEASTFNTAAKVVGVAVDADAKLVWFRTGSGNWNNASTANPSTGVGGIAYTITGEVKPAVCSDSASVWTGNFSGNFANTIPAGFRAWAADSYKYVVPYATANTPGIVVAGAGIDVDANGVLSVDSYYDMATVQGGDAITIDLTTPTPGYHVILGSASATFSFSNLSLPAGKALRLTFYFEQGTGNNVIGTWDPAIKWVGATPILAFTKGARNVIEFETIDGTTWAGYYVGQINM